MRPIDADAVDKRLQDINDGLKKMFENSRFEFMRDDIAAQITTIHEIRRQIMSVPTIDAEPVRHGKWRTVNVPKKWGGATLRCSECNTGAIRLWNYCPDCGAKMDGGEEK